MKYRHTNLMVCSRVRHKWDIDARWITVRHISDMWFYVSHLKNIIFRLEHTSDTTGDGLNMHRTRLGRASNMTWIQLKLDLIFFFSII